MATALAVVTAAVLAFVTGADGKGALKLWPMFGGVNQLLAALTLIVLTLYLTRRGGYTFLVTGLPCVFMVIMTIWGVSLNEISFIQNKNWLLVIINGAILILSLWLVCESIRVFMNLRNQKEH